MLRNLGEAYDQDSYTPYGLLVQLGAPATVATATTLLLGIVLVACAYRRCSLTLFVAAALVLSPIVWLDYYALLALPLALVVPRFHWIWLVPLVTWGMASAGPGVGDATHSLRLLGAFLVITIYTVRLEGRTAADDPSFAPQGRTAAPSKRAFPA
jgi:hypothetical protein